MEDANLSAGAAAGVRCRPIRAGDAAVDPTNSIDLIAACGSATRS
jgi:hypothetical protein